MAKRHHRDDLHLVKRLIRGDEAAFEEFANGYLPALYRFAQRRLDGDGDLARDIAQTTICKILPKLSSYRGEAAFMTWLCACCRNEIAAHFRKAPNSAEHVEMPTEALENQAAKASPFADGPERRLLRGERADLVHDVLDSLPPSYGRALTWKYLEDLSVKQIAVRLNLGPKAAESLLTRARNAFRTAYSRMTALESPGPHSASLAGRKMVLEP